MNGIAVEEARKQRQDDESNDDDSMGGSPTVSSSASAPAAEQITMTNQGKLLLDATCAPADIAYPTDLSLLNQAREKLEKIIDILHEPYQGKQAKPRTYRQKARQSYLTIAKQRREKKSKMRKAIDCASFS